MTTPTFTEETVELLDATTRCTLYLGLCDRIARLEDNKRNADDDDTGIMGWWVTNELQEARRVQVIFDSWYAANQDGN